MVAYVKCSRRFLPRRDDRSFDYRSLGGEEASCGRDATSRHSCDSYAIVRCETDIWLDAITLHSRELDVSTEARYCLHDHMYARGFKRSLTVSRLSVSSSRDDRVTSIMRDFDLYTVSLGTAPYRIADFRHYSLSHAASERVMWALSLSHTCTYTHTSSFSFSFAYDTFDAVNWSAHAIRPKIKRCELVRRSLLSFLVFKLYSWKIKAFLVTLSNRSIW